MPTDFPTLIPVKTRRLNPPQDDLYAVLKDSLPPLQEGDIVVVSSKVVAIHEGRCVPTDSTTKDALVEQETPYWLPRETNPYHFMLTLHHHTIIGSAGVDASNSGNYFTLLPQNPLASTQQLYHWLRAEHGLSRMGVVMTDSHSIALRRGAIGVALAAHGFHCLQSYVGQEDLFGRPFKIERANLPDALAAAAGSIMGEGAEQTPVVILRNWPHLTYTEQPTWQDLTVDPEDDVFRALLEPFFNRKD